MERITIYTKDIQILTGKSERCCRNILKQIKKANNKKPHQIVTFKECFEYLGIPTEESLMILKTRK
ncbi:hypothetical protein [Flavobacterium sp.]|uniref:hypothetical protein n=1 Tax=Flavobacterium sp. TaxID=239 RepID=UPI00286A8CEC|nr:hypothetical protein [Flavobacterium sp.]